MSRHQRWWSSLLILVLLGTNAMAQTYLATASPMNAGNPGGIRTAFDNSQNGGTIAWQGPSISSEWSSVQTIPFPFEFNGSVETGFVVTNNGLLSFDVSVAGLSASLATQVNASLPVSGLPDKTIAYFWDDFNPLSSSFNYIYVSVSGTAPNRQLWVHNYSVPIGSLGYAYWAVVLEETSNSIYVVDMNHYDPFSFGSMSGTIGVQIDGTTAFEVAGSPNINFNSATNTNPWVVSNNEYYRFDFYPAGACLPVTNVAFANISKTSADVSFSHGSATSTTVEYGPEGFTPGTGISQSALGNMSTIGSLSPNTLYDVYLTADCSGTLSNQSGPYRFRTECESVTIYPFTENFDDSTWISPSTLNHCWNAYNGFGDYEWNVATTGTWGTGPSTDFSGSGNYVFTESANAGDTAFLETPVMDMTFLSAPELTFRYMFYGADIDRMYIEGSSDNGATWTKLDSIIGQQQIYATDPWQERLVDLTPVKSSTTIIRFTGVAGFGSFGNMAIDEVSIDEQPSCPKPQAISAFDITSTTAEIFWTSNQSDFTLEWGATGFTVGTGLGYASSNDTTGITNLIPDTEYDIYVTANCSGSDVSTPAGPYTFRTAIAPYYLEDFNSPFVPQGFFEASGPFGAISGWSLYAGGWRDGTYANQTGGSQSARINLYSGFRTPNEWLISPPIDLGTGNNYQLEVDLAWTDYDVTSAAAPSAGDTIHVVISTDGGQTWNRADILESFHMNNTVLNGSGTHKIYSLNSYSGVVRIGFYGTTQGNGANTEFFVDNFKVRTPPACFEPYDFAPIAILADSIYFKFAADAGASGYAIEFGSCGFTPGSGTADTLYNDTAGFGGLSAATCYEFYVQSICMNGPSTWSGPFSFVTSCDTLPIPWTEGFETAAVPDWSPCWTDNHPDPYYMATEVANLGSTSGPHSGSQYGFHREHGTQEKWTFTPQFHLRTGYSYQISFWYQSAGLSPVDVVKLAYGTGQSAVDMTQVVFSDSTVTGASYRQAVVTFIPAQTGDYYFGLSSNSSGWDSELNFDDFQLQFDPNPCPDASSLSALVASENEADLLWGATFSHTTFDVEWGPSGFTPGTGTGHIVSGLTTPALNIDTLSPNTCYDYYVTAYCSGSATGQIGPFQFCTPCSVSPLPYFEDFNLLPWDCVDANAGTGPWVQDLGWAMAEFYYYDDDFIMNMQPVDISVDARVKFKWSHVSAGFNPTDILSVRARIMGTTTWDTIWTIGGSSFNSMDGATPRAAGTGVKEEILLDPATYTGEVVEFQIFGDSEWGPNVFIDDFSVDAVPTCHEPYSADFLAGSETSSSGAIYFTPGGASDFNIAFGDASMVTVPGQGQVTLSTNDTVTLTSLNPGTTYNVWVRDSCGPGDVSSWEGPVQFTTLCLPITMPYVEDFDFNSWPPACIDLSAGNDDWDQQGSWARARNYDISFTDFVMQLPEVILTDSAELSFKWSHFFNPFSQDELYIRYRSSSSTTWDTLWSRTGSAFGSADGAVGANAGTGVVERIPIPNMAAGDTVVIQFYDISNGGANAYIDDINIYAKRNCPPTSGLNASNITATSFDANWTAGSAGATTWYVEYGPPGFTPGSGTSIMANGTSVNVPNLSTSTDYCFYVTEICPGSTDSSATMGPVCVTTLCEEPTAVSASVVSCSEISLSWTSGNATSLIEYGVSGFTPGTGTYLTGASGTVVPGLATGTSYDFYVGTVCNSDTAWAADVSETTLAGPMPTVDSVTVSRIAVNATFADYKLVAYGMDIDSVHWDFGTYTETGDSVLAAFGSNGVVNITITASNACGDTTFNYVILVNGISVEENLLARSLSIFPNPSSGIVTVEFDLESSQDVRIVILNSLGQPVETENAGSVSSYTGQLDLSHLSKGMYIISIQSGSDIINRRIVLQ